MAAKIGRNDPCPCGSGKKFKKCCIKKEQQFSKPNSSTPLGDLISRYDTDDLLKINAACQLVPQNHGKNVRFEIIARQLTRSIQTSVKPEIQFSSLLKFFKENLTDHYLEDPVSSFFSENISWYGGDHTVLPGLTTGGTRILRTTLEAIFLQKNQLPIQFKHRIGQATTLILAISESITSNAGLTRNLFEEPIETEIEIPERSRLEFLKQVVTFSQDEIKDLVNTVNSSIQAFEAFVVDREDKDLYGDDADSNPLLRRPIVKTIDGEYVFALPTAIVDCLLQYLKEQSMEFGCQDMLLELIAGTQWDNSKKLLTKIDWAETSIQLPPSESKLFESVYRFDNDKLAYVRFIMPGMSNPEDQRNAFENIGKGKRKPRDKRVNVVIDFLRNELNVDYPYRYFILNILGESFTVDYYSFSTNGSKNDLDQLLVLKYGELETLVHSEELDALGLWKFANVRTATYSNSSVPSMPLFGILDSYSYYRTNGQSLTPSDAPKMSFMSFSVGLSNDFEREVQGHRDEHSVRQRFNGEIRLAPVTRYKDFAPIYGLREQNGARHELVLECFSSPLWVKNTQAKQPADKWMINIFSEAIVYWIFRMKDELKPYLNQFTANQPVEIEIELEDGIIHPSVVDEIKSSKTDIEVECLPESLSLMVKLSEKIMFDLMKSNNVGEQKIMRSVLSGMSDLLKSSELEYPEIDLVDTWVKKIMIPTSAKMIIVVDSSRDLRLDNRWILPFRAIQESDVSHILENLVDKLDLESPIPETIDNIEDKKKLCNRIVAKLVDEIVLKMQKYPSETLLKWLMSMHEGCIQKREYQEIDIPAKVSCCSDFASEVGKLVKTNKEFVQTTLAVRCLIEFVAAQPGTGDKWVNLDDLDELIALMEQVFQWGMMSDSIELGMDDPQMGLLPSGQIGTESEFLSNYLKPFSHAMAESSIVNFQENFDVAFEGRPEVSEKPRDKPLMATKLDEAFKEEFGIEYTALLKVMWALAEIAIDGGDSVAIKDVDDLAKLTGKMKSMAESEVDTAIELLSLYPRKSIVKVPKGFEQGDIYPWRYNRELSYLRKPIIRDLNDKCLWSYRHMIDCVHNLQFLIQTGRLKAKDGGKLSAFIKGVNVQKGKDFRNDVATWLGQETSLEIVPHEVKPFRLSGLDEDRKFGDIDIAAIDKTRRVFYSIECKNTVGARVMHEMKTEMDKYLGRTEADSWVHKHARRHEWLLKNQNLLGEFVENPEKFKIVSLLLTSTDLPVIYLAKEKSPLPLVSFPSLKRNGVAAFNVR
ncbi:MAG: SEC-C domain-containing protein [Flavobacteriales bacterium]|nr:SEC-C domain-containing protein [Flavobacteriales bacterium]